MNYPPVERRLYAGTEVALCKYAECDSTNDLVARLLHDEQWCAAQGIGDTIPVVVCAAAQSKGRGRRGKEWMGNAGENLYMSVGIRSPRWTPHIADYQLLGCMAVRNALLSFIPDHHIALKYPNDIQLLVNNTSVNSSSTLLPSSILRKVCGVLVETEFRGSDLSHVVCGIGVNVNQQIFTSQHLLNATSIRVATGHVVHIENLLHLVLHNFFTLLNTSADAVFEQWERSLELIGKRICCEHSVVSEFDTPLSTMHRVVRVERDGTLCVKDITDSSEASTEHILSPQVMSFRVCSDDNQC